MMALHIIPISNYILKNIQGPAGNCCCDYRAEVQRGVSARGRDSKQATNTPPQEQVGPHHEGRES